MSIHWYGTPVNELSRKAMKSREHLAVTHAVKSCACTGGRHQAGSGLQFRHPAAPDPGGAAPGGPLRLRGHLGGGGGREAQPCHL